MFAHPIMASQQHAGACCLARAERTYVAGWVQHVDVDVHCGLRLWDAMHRSYMSDRTADMLTSMHRQVQVFALLCKI